MRGQHIFIETPFDLCSYVMKKAVHLKNSLDVKKTDITVNTEVSA